MRIVFYISGHGFGHASRDIELIRAILTRRPDARVTVRTAAPRWLFDLNADPGVEIQALDADTGMVQIDSLRLDEEGTAREAARFYADFDRRVTEETERLRRLRATIVLGDIPPLAFAAAARARVPSVAIGNFTWDWIYAVYPAFERLAPGVLHTIRQAYAAATLALRLPLHGGFDPMAGVTRDIPFIARQSVRDRRDVRHMLDLPGDRPVVLASFGGYGADLPVERLRQSERFTLIPPMREPPAGLGYADLVAAADVVVSKPGYGIVSECVANDTALLYTSRGRFIEYDMFVADMPRVLRCRYIPQEDLFAGRWTDAIETLLAQPRPAERPRIDGAAVAADAIIRLNVERSYGLM
jgi:L-arabinokinase